MYFRDNLRAARAAVSRRLLKADGRGKKRADELIAFYRYGHSPVQ
jgi:hypothetical protein